MPVVACCRLLPPTVGSGCLVLRVACRWFWMPAIASAARCRFWMSGVASRLPTVLDARRRSLRFGTGELRSAPALPSGLAPSFAPEPLRPHPDFIPAPLRNHSGLTPTSSRPRSGTTPSLAPTSSRPRLGTTTEPVPERVVPRVPGRPLLINYRKLWPEICRKAPGIGYFCEKQP